MKILSAAQKLKTDGLHDTINYYKKKSLLSQKNA